MDGAAVSSKLDYSQGASKHVGSNIAQKGADIARVWWTVIVTMTVIVAVTVGMGITMRVDMKALT